MQPFYYIISRHGAIGEYKDIGMLNVAEHFKTLMFFGCCFLGKPERKQFLVHQVNGEGVGVQDNVIYLTYNMEC